MFDLEKFKIRARIFAEKYFLSGNLERKVNCQKVINKVIENILFLY